MGTTYTSYPEIKRVTYVRSSDIGHLMDKVNRELQNGFTPLGGVVWTGTKFIQTMVIYNES